MNVTKKTVLEVDYIDLDESITEFLKSKNYSDKNFDRWGYESMAENEWCRGQSHTFTVANTVWGFWKSRIDSGNFSDLSTDLILNWMCSEGIIEPGDYLVNVS